MAACHAISTRYGVVEDPKAMWTSLCRCRLEPILHMKRVLLPHLCAGTAGPQVFVYDEQSPPVEEINLQSFYRESGEEVSYMRETAALAALRYFRTHEGLCHCMRPLPPHPSPPPPPRGAAAAAAAAQKNPCPCPSGPLLTTHREAGVTAPLAIHVLVYLNGNFFGLYAIIEQIDETFLEVLLLTTTTTTTTILTIVVVIFTISPPLLSSYHHQYQQHHDPHHPYPRLRRCHHHQHHRYILISKIIINIITIITSTTIRMCHQTYILSCCCICMVPLYSHHQYSVLPAAWRLSRCWLPQQLCGSYAQRNRLPGEGPIFKSVSGMQSNYRHDVPASAGWVFSKIYRPSNPAANGAKAFAELLELTSGLSGGQGCSRAAFLLGSVDLPAVCGSNPLPPNVDNAVL